MAMTVSIKVAKEVFRFMPVKDLRNLATAANRVLQQKKKERAKR
jgi:hypothetical protein